MSYALECLYMIVKSESYFYAVKVDSSWCRQKTGPLNFSCKNSCRSFQSFVWVLWHVGLVLQTWEKLNNKKADMLLWKKLLLAWEAQTFLLYFNSCQVASSHVTESASLSFYLLTRGPAFSWIVISHISQRSNLKHQPRVSRAVNGALCKINVD